MFNPIIEVIDVPLQILVVDDEEIQRVLPVTISKKKGLSLRE